MFELFYKDLCGLGIVENLRFSNFLFLANVIP